MQEFECYRVVLSFATDYFDIMLSTSMKESQTSRISLPDKDPEEWKLFYTFVDPSLCREAKVTKANAMTLVPWFHEFQMTRLLDECDKFIAARLVPKKKHNFHRLPSLIATCDSYGLEKTYKEASYWFYELFELSSDNGIIVKEIIEVSKTSDWMWTLFKEHLDEEFLNVERNTLLTVGSYMLPPLFQARSELLQEIAKRKR